jgi:hypothetical protein
MRILNSLDCDPKSLAVESKSRDVAVVYAPKTPGKSCFQQGKARRGYRTTDAAIVHWHVFQRISLKSSRDSLLPTEGEHTAYQNEDTGG